MDLASGFTIGRVRGISIRVHWSWLLIFGLLTWAFSEGLFGSDFAESSAARWAAALTTAFLFFLSVLLHELSHSFVALRYGMAVPSITLFVFGGVSNLGGEMHTPGQEFRIAIAGPLMSWALAIVFGGLWLVIPGGAAGTMFGYLAFINGLLGVFNLLPGFPLDGGRVFRSILWARTGNLMTATRIASRVGVGIAYLMIAVGLLNVLFFGLFGGLWYVFIGLFLKSASEGAYASLLVETALKDIAVTDVMSAPPLPVPADMSLQRLADERILASGERAFFIERNAEVVGLITATDLARLPRQEWSAIPVAQVMVPTADVAVVAPTSGLLEAMRLMQERDVHQLPVVEDGRVAGLVTRADVLRHIELRSVFQPPEASAKV